MATLFKFGLNNMDYTAIAVLLKFTLHLKCFFLKRVFNNDVLIDSGRSQDGVHHS